MTRRHFLRVRLFNSLTINKSYSSRYGFTKPLYYADCYNINYIDDVCVCCIKIIVKRIYCSETLLPHCIHVRLNFSPLKRVFFRLHDMIRQ